jgi:16S rRNA processing protein RimM
MSPVDDEDLVLIGKVTGAHGVQGEVKIYPYSGEPGSFLRYSRVLLAAGQDAAPAVYNVERARVQKDRLIVQVDGCTTRAAAEQLVHASVYVRADDLPKPGPDEFYLRDLEGRQMKTEDGRVIGRIAAVLPGSQDIAQVEQDGQEYLIPLVPEFIVAIEKDAVTVALPPGLLEINA